MSATSPTPDVYRPHFEVIEGAANPSRPYFMVTFDPETRLVLAAICSADPLTAEERDALRRRAMARIVASLQTELRRWPTTSFPSRVVCDDGRAA